MQTVCKAYGTCMALLALTFDATVLRGEGWVEVKWVSCDRLS